MCGSGKVRSGTCKEFSRYSDKISLAAEREPFPVGIGDGGGACMFNSLTLRIIDMAGCVLCGQMNGRSKKERKKKVVVCFSVSSKGTFFFKF